MKTLVGLIPDTEHVKDTEGMMNAAGIRDYKLNVLDRPGEVWRRLGGHEKMRGVYKHALIGALLGLGVAALYGLPASITTCIYRGCAFSDNMGSLVAISLYWIIAGAFLGAIIGLDRLEQDMYSYVEGVRRGGSLMIVETPDEEVAQVAEILGHEGGLLVHTLADER